MITIFRRIHGEKWELNGVAQFLGAEEVTLPWYIADKCSYTAVIKTCVAALPNCGPSISVIVPRKSITMLIFAAPLTCSTLQRLNLGTCFRRAKVDQQQDTSTRRFCTVTQCIFTAEWRIFKKGTIAGDGMSTALRGLCWRTNQVLGLFMATRRADCQVAC